MFLYQYIDKEWLPFHRKACRKKEMGLYVADIKTVNQQVNEQEDIKLLEKVPEIWHLYL